MAYLHGTFSDQPSWSQLEDKVREARQSMHGP
jgi:hypothetical protein